MIVHFQSRDTYARKAAMLVMLANRMDNEDERRHVLNRAALNAALATGRLS